MGKLTADYLEKQLTEVVGSDLLEKISPENRKAAFAGMAEALNPEAVATREKGQAR